MKYSSVIFDFDGTLFDTQDAIATALMQTFSDEGLPRPDEGLVRSSIRRGITLEETFETLLPGSEYARVPDLVSVYRKLYNAGLGLSKSRPFEGIVQLVRDLASRPEPIIVCSNKGRLAVERSLEHHEILSAVDLIVAADGLAPTKPDPTSFHDRIRPMIGEVASRAPLVIGDTDADIRYAHAIGADVCWAAYGYGDPAKCEPLRPTYAVREPSQLMDVLGLSRPATARARPDAVDSTPSRMEDNVLARHDDEPDASNAEFLEPLDMFRSPGLSRQGARVCIHDITTAALSRAGAFLGHSPLLVPIARAGMAMWAAADAHFEHPQTAILIGRKIKGTSEVTITWTAGLRPGIVDEVLLLDTVSATGDTIIEAAREICQQISGVRVSALICYASPEAVKRMRACRNLHRFCVAVQSRSVDEGGWLLPSIGGDAGDKLYGVNA